VPLPDVVTNNFMAIVREYTMTYSAIELLGERETIEKNIEDKAKADQIAKLTKLELQTKREQEDFEIETKEKELKFSLEKQKNDSLMMQIDANAFKNYQNTINSSLTDRLLKFKSIEVTKELAKSSNAKIIITDGKTMMVNNVGDK
jgi:prohibitin 1